jgi:hypothetical protein
MNPLEQVSWDAVSNSLLTAVTDKERSGDVAQLVARLMAVLCGDPSGYAKYFALWEQHGFHVTPVHFYQPLPDTRTLTDRPWVESATPGIEWNEAQQLRLLQHFAQFQSEYDLFPSAPTGVDSDFYLNQNLFDGTDALVLYCMVRHFKPSIIFEVGSGMSSLLSAKAALKNGATTLVCVEPSPNEVLKNGFPGLTSLFRQNVQDVSLETFEKLGENDILFIDSTHVVKIGSDVNYLFLEVLPRLQPGVIVHVHDIFLPEEYPRPWVLNDFRFWTEQYLLHAFLCHNSAFEILFANNYMGVKHREAMQATFPRSPWWGGGSFWMRRKVPGRS